MTISAQQFELFLCETHRYTLKRYYQLGNAIYANMLSPNYRLPILVQLPNGFSIDAAPLDKFDMKQVKPELDIYNVIDINQSASGKPATGKYKKPIKLAGDPDQQNMNKTVAAMIAQIERLNYSLSTVPYKFWIAQLGVIVSPNCIAYTGFPNTRERELIICVSFDDLYDKINVFERDIKHIFKEIKTIMATNSISHLDNFDLLMKKRELYVSTITYLYKAQTEMDDYIQRFIDMYTTNNKLINERESTINKLKAREMEYIHDVLRRDARIKQLDTEIRKLEHSQRELELNIIKYRTQSNSISLMIDNLTFSNLVLIDRIWNNLDDLEALKSTVNT